MFSKIKHKLFLYFLLFSSISLLAVITSVWFYNKRENLTEASGSLDEIYILSLKSFKLQQDFLNNEVINEDYFQTDKSLILDQHDLIKNKIKSKFKSIHENLKNTEIEASLILDRIQNELNSNDSIFREVIYQYKIIGFQDFGVEGEMRKHAHVLMKLDSEIEQVKILMLRRHEKDYIIRKDYSYVLKFSSLIVDVENDIIQNNNISNKKKKYILDVLDNYYLSFKKLVKVEIKLGFKSKTGLLHHLSNNGSIIQNDFEKIKDKVSENESEILNEINKIALITSILIILLTVFFSYYVASALTRPLIQLTHSIKKYVNSDFTIFPMDPSKSSNYEIETLKGSFILMSKEITSHINYFKEKVEERTLEIMHQKDEILIQQDEIIAQRDLLKIQKKKVTEKNKSIMDSIRYAKRIQNAILPQEVSIQAILPDSFVLYEPKDVVSGDFYWIDKIHHELLSDRNEVSNHVFNNRHSVDTQSSNDLLAFNYFEDIQCVDSAEKIMFAAVDCTGHGVPGALMSVIGYNSLNKIIYEYKKIEPAEILNQLNQEIRQTLRQDTDKSEVKDGMDIALCSLDLENKILHFSGANNPLYLIRNHELKIIKGDRFPIGVYNDESNQLFKNHTINLERGDAIYIFSDGYTDQFGGPKGKKFNKKQFRALLLEIYELDMKVQKVILKNALDVWKGNLLQVDDILVIGVKIE